MGRCTMIECSGCPNCTPCSTSRTVPVGSRSAIFFTRKINGSRRSSRSILRTRSPNLMVGRLPDRSDTTPERPDRAQALTTLFPGSPFRQAHDGRAGARSCSPPTLRSTSGVAWFPGELPTDRLGVVAELRTGGTDTPGTPAELGHHVGHRHGPGVSRRGFPYDHVACGVLLVAYDVLGCVDPAPGDLVLVEHLLELLGGQRTHPPLDDPVQLLGVVTACLVCGKTFVHLQPLLPHRLAETAVETVAVGGDEHFMPVRAGVDVRRRHTGKGAPGTGTSDPTEFPIGD